MWIEFDPGVVPPPYFTKVTISDGGGIAATAKTLALTVLPSLRARADEVIK
jgi:hypothetical protein